MKTSKSSLSRTARLTRLGVELAAGTVGFALANAFVPGETRAKRRIAHEQKCARKIRSELQTLRGPAMKLGQTLSLQSHLIDERAIEELSRLQMSAPGMHPTLMRVQFKTEMGVYPEQLFSKFDPEPFAAASLGQVHHAVTKEGKDVVVKIQYPAVREMIETDFAALSKVMLPVRWTEHVPASAIEELRRGILAECSYRNEAANIECFRGGLAPLAFVRVPCAYPELSGERVLTMSRLPGRHLDEFLKSNPSQATRNRLGRQLMELFCHQAYKMRLLHSDPHPGNYLFDTEEIGLIDFGNVTKLSPQVVDAIMIFSSRRWLDDSAACSAMMRVLRRGKSGTNDASARATLETMLGVYTQLYRTDGDETDFADPELMKKISRMAKTSIGAKFLSAEFVFYSRAEMGLYLLLHRLRARIPAYRIATGQMALP